MEKNPRFRPPILAAFFLAYILLRLWGLTSSCLWFDEIFGVHAAEHTWSGLFWFVAQDLIHPPLFYILLKIWIAVGGESLLWLRLFAVFFSALSLAPFLLLARELKLKFLAVVVGLGLFAVNGSLIKYAQEVRMYSLLLFFSLVSMWLFARFFYRGKNIWILTLANTLLVYTHYFGWLVIASEIIAILIFQKIKIRHVLIMAGIAAASYIPWVWFLWQVVRAGSDVNQNVGWIARPGFAAIFDFIFDIVEPFYSQQSSIDPTSLLYFSVPMLVIFGAAKIVYYIDWKLESEHSRFFFLTTLTVVPVSFALIASWLLPFSIWGSRHLIIVFSPMLMLAAIFISEAKLIAARAVFATAVLLITAGAFTVRLNTERADYAWCGMERLANEWINAPNRSTEPKTLYVVEDLAAYHFWFAVRGLDKYQVRVVRGVEGTVNDPAYFLPRGFDEVKIVNPDDIVDEEFWIAYREPKPEGELPFVSGTYEGSQVLSFFAGRGYQFRDVRKLDIGNESVYLILMRKSS